MDLGHRNRLGSAMARGPSPIKIGRSSGRAAGTPWLPRTSPGSSGITSNKRAKPQLLLDEPADRAALGPPQARVEEQLARVVPWLAVDVDRPREIRGQAVIEPVGISEPRVGLRQHHELARPRMVQSDLAPVVARPRRAQRREAP